MHFRFEQLAARNHQIMPQSAMNQRKYFEERQDIYIRNTYIIRKKRKKTN